MMQVSRGAEITPAANTEISGFGWDGLEARAVSKANWVPAQFPPALFPISILVIADARTSNLNLMSR